MWSLKTCILARCVFRRHWHDFWRLRAILKQSRQIAAAPNDCENWYIDLVKHLNEMPYKTSRRAWTSGTKLATLSAVASGVAPSIAVTSIDTAEPTAPKRDLNAFLVAMSVALHRHSMYPSDHPSIGPGVEEVHRRASELLADRSSIAFGVARRQLIIDGVATDPNQPVLRRLAEGLHGHHFGAVSLHAGVQADEIGHALLLLSTEPQRSGQLGLAEGGVPTWPHVKLHSLTFDGLALIGDAELTTDGSGGTGDTLGAELWLGLARAALSGDEAAQGDSVPSEPSEVARAIDDHPSAEAYDQAIVGYLLQIARELKVATGAQGEALRKKTASLIGSLRSDTLERLVAMGGDVTQRGEFVLDAAHGMNVKAVLQIVKAAAQTSGQTISHGLLRMLSKLASQAENGSAHSRPRADAELRDQVARLTSDWNLADPNPEHYSHVLQHIAGSERADDSDSPPPHPTNVGGEPLRILKMSLECGVFGPLASKALIQVVAGGQASAVQELVTGHPRGAAAAGVSEAMRSALAQPETLHVIATREPVDFTMLECLAPCLTMDGYTTLLDALTTSEVRTTRRRLLDLLTHADLDITEPIVERLEGTAWYVQRNMLVLLHRRGEVPDGLSLTPWLSHLDGRVRTEAIRLQLQLPGERDSAVVTAMADHDPRIAELGLREAMKQCPPAAVPRVAELALEPETSEGVRCLAASALGQVRQPRALGVLLKLTDGGRSFWGRRKLAPRSPVLLASLKALAQHRAADPLAVSILAAAARSSDPELRQAAQGAGS
jgi:hypothetical protein